MHLTLKTGRIMGPLAAIVAVLTVCNAVVLWIKYRWRHDTLYGLTPLFDFNREGNLPAFFSACALLLAAVLLFVIAGETSDRRDRWRRHWLALGIIFTFLAVDEAAELHGLLSLPLRRLAQTSGVFYYAWVIPYGLLTLVFVALYYRFFRALPPRQRPLILAAGVIYVLGALGMELVGSAIVTALGGPDRGLDHWAHAIAYSVEELLEMVGVLILIYALLEHIAEQRMTLSLDVGVNGRADDPGDPSSRSDAGLTRRPPRPPTERTPRSRVPPRRTRA